MDVVLVLEDVQYMLRNWLKEPTGILTVTAFHILEAEVIHLCIIQSATIHQCLLCAARRARLWGQTE